MKELTINKYGSVLTGREFGQRIVRILEAEKTEFPVKVNFRGVMALGSSFADEVLAFIAKNQDNRIVVLNAAKAVVDCIKDVAIDKGFSVTFDGKG